MKKITLDTQLKRQYREELLGTHETILRLKNLIKDLASFIKVTPTQDKELKEYLIRRVTQEKL